jgi:hypothetical protein
VGFFEWFWNVCRVPFPWWVGAGWVLVEWGLGQTTGGHLAVSGEPSMDSGGGWEGVSLGLFGNMRMKARSKLRQFSRSCVPRSSGARSIALWPEATGSFRQTGMPASGVRAGFSNGVFQGLFRSQPAPMAILR